MTRQMSFALAFLPLLLWSCDDGRGKSAPGGGSLRAEGGDDSSESMGEGVEAADLPPATEVGDESEGQGETAAGGGEGEGEGEGEGAAAAGEGVQGEGSAAEGEPADGGPGEGPGDEEAEEGGGAEGQGGEGGALGDECARNSDCDSPLICTPQGTCDVECVEDRDCDGAGEGCKDGVCQAPGADCDGNGDCLPDELCHEGRCRAVPDCVFPDDCDDGLTCVQGHCIDQGDEGGGQEGGDEGQPGEGGGDEGGGQVGECPGAPGRPAVPPDYGQDCQRAADCACNLCFDVAPVGGSGVCTGYCLTDVDCPALDVCRELDGVRACVANDVGEGCRDPAECNFAICLNDPAGGGAVCTLECESRLDCGQGMGCGIVRNQQGGDMYACVPVGGRCGAAAGCSGSRCLPDRAGGDQGYCTHDCRTSADCDLGNVCCGIPGADGCPVGVCVRGGCPAACGGDQDCPQGWGCFNVDAPDGGESPICVNLACVGARRH